MLGLVNDATALQQPLKATLIRLDPLLPFHCQLALETVPSLDEEPGLAGFCIPESL
jgi:hypothetical protein